MPRGTRLPQIATAEVVDKIDFNQFKTKEEQSQYLDFFTASVEGKLVLYPAAATPRILETSGASFSRCIACGELAIWFQHKMVYPMTGMPIPVNPDTPADIRRDYEEAAAIFQPSPRGAAALLRLAIEKLCRHLRDDSQGKSLDSLIGELVKDGAPRDLQMMLDSVRVIGNEQVHPGTIDLRDDTDTAAALFRIFNLIVERMISVPAEIEEIYGKLPPNKIDGINNRDGRKSEPE